MLYCRFNRRKAEQEATSSFRDIITHTSKIMPELKQNSLKMQNKSCKLMFYASYGFDGAGGMRQMQI